MKQLVVKYLTEFLSKFYTTSQTIYINKAQIEKERYSFIFFFKCFFIVFTNEPSFGYEK
jgi:hypothetical protein